MVLFLTAGVTYAQSPAKYEKGGGVQEVVTNNKLERNFWRWPDHKKKPMCEVVFEGRPDRGEREFRSVGYVFA